MVKQSKKQVDTLRITKKICNALIYKIFSELDPALCELTEFECGEYTKALYFFQYFYSELCDYEVYAEKNNIRITDKVLDEFIRECVNAYEELDVLKEYKFFNEYKEGV